jgi:hypothetical protein
MARQGTDREPRSPLDRWMRKHRVSNAIFANEMGMSPSSVASLRAAEYQPSDVAKLKVAEVTLRLEREWDLREPVGVPAAAWLELAAARAC